MQNTFTKQEFQEKFPRLSLLMSEMFHANNIRWKEEIILPPELVIAVPTLEAPARYVVGAGSKAIELFTDGCEADLFMRLNERTIWLHIFLNEVFDGRFSGVFCGPGPQYP